MHILLHNSLKIWVKWAEPYPKAMKVGSFLLQGAVNDARSVAFVSHKTDFRNAIQLFVKPIRKQNT